MLIPKGVIGIILLFLGYELNFLFSGSMAALLAIRLTPLLPPEWPAWAHYAFIIGFALLAAAIPLINERVGYFVSGFLAGGYFMVEYFAPGVLTVPLLPFIVGGVIGSAIMGILTIWAMIPITSLIGAYYATGLFNNLSPIAEMLITAGFFIVGALTQIIINRALYHRPRQGR